MADVKVIKIAIPGLGSDVEFSELRGHDAIGAPFSYDLRVSTRDFDLKPEDVLGTLATVTIDSEKPRHFNGVVAEFGLHEIRADFAYYRLLLRPWLWLLSLRTNNRIFQKLTAVEIIEKVFSDHPSAKFEKRLQKTYPPRDYCVQYGESDLGFVQRLIEHEGMFYYFEHADGAHTLVLGDTNSDLKPAEGAEKLAYEPDDRRSFQDGAFVTLWTPMAQVRPGKWAHTDYDFKKPSSDLMAKFENPLGHGEDGAENYAYPGDYIEHGRGDALATLRLEEAQSAHVRIRAKGTTWPLWSGHAFTLERFPRAAENGDYIAIRMDYHLWDERVRSGQTEAQQGFQAEMLVAPAALPFRLERSKPRQMMRGPQTAIVVGPAGEEIFTDEYARVKVQFYWDREGKKDENTTCFIRVSAAWAGANWGFIQIPRIGQEVIVDFLEGDPDQPVITGRLYNAEQMPPYGLPGSATQSGWKSNSSPGGGGFNELRFEDKAGSEEVYFQAQKDHNELIKNDETREIGHDFKEDVGNDATQSIGHDRTESVANDKSVSVGNNRTVSIGVDDTETVGSNRALSVGSNETIDIGSNSTEKIGVAHTQTVGAVQTISVGAARADKVGGPEVRSVGASQTNTIGSSRAMTVGSSQTHTIGSSDTWKIGSDQSVTIGAKNTISVASDQGVKIGGGQSTEIAKDQGIKIGGAQLTEVAKDAALKVAGAIAVTAGKTFMLEAADSIVLKTGSAAISMKKDGTISIEGKDITVTGSGKITIKASSEVKVTGSKIENN